MTRLSTLTINQAAFLDMIAASEIGAALLAVSDNGYNVLVGSTPKAPLLFTSYADHPRKYNSVMNSTASGRYQVLARYFDAYKVLLGLPDFSPESQDAIALQQIKERGAFDSIESGNLPDAIQRCSNIWASLPGNDYGQHENKLASLQQAYVNAGGIIAA
jgi:muramidase (phage lysozyme)